MNELITKIISPDFELKEEKDFYYLTGYASIFDNVDLQNDVIHQGAYTKTIKENLSNGSIKLLSGHDPTLNNVMGVVIEAEERRKGLWFKAKISKVPSVTEIIQKIKDGIIDKLSVGFNVVKWDMEEKGNQMIRHIKEVFLREISVVTFAANPMTYIEGVKSHCENICDESIKIQKMVDEAIILCRKTLEMIPNDKKEIIYKALLEKPEVDNIHKENSLEIEPEGTPLEIKPNDSIEAPLVDKQRSDNDSLFEKMEKFESEIKKFKN